MVVHGLDGLDEITLTTKTYVCEINQGELVEYEIDPREFGFEFCIKESLSGGTPEENATIIREVLSGIKNKKRDIVVLNSGAALYISGRVQSIYEGIKLAESTIDSGLAIKKLDEFISLTNKLKMEDVL